MKLVKVKNRKQKSQFLDFTYEINSKYENWVPPLRLKLAEQLFSKKHPFRLKGKIDHFLLMDQERVVAKCSLVRDLSFDNLYGKDCVFFGHFDIIDNENVSTTFFELLKHEVRKLSYSKLIGPINLSMNYECGLLIDGFDDPSTLMLNYNPPYYSKILESSKFYKKEDLNAYTYEDGVGFPDIVIKRSNRILQREGIKLKTIKIREIDSELERIIELYNDTMDVHWGFTPLSREELKFLAKELKPIIDPDLLIVAEKDDKLAGFLFALPDLNQILIKNRNGKLCSLQGIKIIVDLLTKRSLKQIDRIRLMTLGISKEFRHLNLGPIFYSKILEQYNTKCLKQAEASWVMESNKAINQIHLKLGAKLTKKYRIYERDCSVN